MDINEQVLKKMIRKYVHEECIHLEGLKEV